LRKLGSDRGFIPESDQIIDNDGLLVPYLRSRRDEETELEEIIFVIGLKIEETPATLNLDEICCYLE
jgi:hypothetical protein